VDCAKAGDDVTISGLIFQRWRNLNVGDRCDVEIVMLANYCLVHNEQKVYFVISRSGKYFNR
jgi:DNA helicase MCM9